MKANRAYELIVSRGGLEPAFLADGSRHDRVEVVSIEEGRVAVRNLEAVDGTPVIDVKPVLNSRAEER